MLIEVLVWVMACNCPSCRSKRRSCGCRKCLNAQSDIDTNRQMRGGFIGGIKGALIGLAVGGPIGAIVGAKLGIVVGMALKEGVAYVPCGVLPCDFELSNHG